ncbi:MAG: hypothetical protein GYA42_08910 [Syntrophomonadaceae bacterium]|nr:hypothetical protein [Syntrophomonadaceae bacterium]
MEWAGWGALMALGIVFVLMFLAIIVVLYVLKSIGLATMAEKRGIENAWLAWIPIADLYIMGLLVGELDIFGYRLENLGLWTPVIIVGGSMLGNMHGIGWLFSLASFIYAVLLIYRLFEMYTTQAVLYTVLSILLCLFPVFIYVIRNNQLRYVPESGTPAGPQMPAQTPKPAPAPPVSKGQEPSAPAVQQDAGEPTAEAPAATAPDDSSDSGQG